MFPLFILAVFTFAHASGEKTTPTFCEDDLAGSYRSSQPKRKHPVRIPEITFAAGEEFSAEALRKFVKRVRLVIEKNPEFLRIGIESIVATSRAIRDVNEEGDLLITIHSNPREIYSHFERQAVLFRTKKLAEKIADRGIIVDYSYFSTASAKSAFSFVRSLKNILNKNPSYYRKGIKRIRAAAASADINDAGAVAIHAESSEPQIDNHLNDQSSSLYRNARARTARLNQFENEFKRQTGFALDLFRVKDQMEIFPFAQSLAEYVKRNRSSLVDLGVKEIRVDSNFRHTNSSGVLTIKLGVSLKEIKQFAQSLRRPAFEQRDRAQPETRSARAIGDAIQHFRELYKVDIHFLDSPQPKKALKLIETLRSLFWDNSELQALGFNQIFVSNLPVLRGVDENRTTGIYIGTPRFLIYEFLKRQTVDRVIRAQEDREQAQLERHEALVQARKAFFREGLRK